MRKNCFGTYIYNLGRAPIGGNKLVCDWWKNTNKNLVDGVEVNIKKYASPASVFWDMKQNLTTFLVMEKNLDKNFYTSPTWDIVTLRTLLLRFGHGGIGGKKLGLKKFYNFYTSSGGTPSPSGF